MAWRRSRGAVEKLCGVAGQRGADGTEREQFEVPRLPSILLRVVCPYEWRDGVLGDLEGRYRRKVVRGLPSARRWYWSQVLSSIRPFLREQLRGVGYSMFNLSRWKRLAIFSVLTTGIVEGLPFVGVRAVNWAFIAVAAVGAVTLVWGVWLALVIRKGIRDLRRLEPEINRAGARFEVLMARWDSGDRGMSFIREIQDECEQYKALKIKSAAIQRGPSLLIR